VLSSTFTTEKSQQTIESAFAIGFVRFVLCKLPMSSHDGIPMECSCFKMIAKLPLADPEPDATGSTSDLKPEVGNKTSALTWGR